MPITAAPEEWGSASDQHPAPTMSIVDLLADHGALRLLGALAEDTCPPEAAPAARPTAVQQVVTALVVRFLQAPQVLPLHGLPVDHPC